MQTCRVEEQLGIIASGDPSCSVLWLLPGSPAELAEAMATVVEASGLAGHGFAAWWTGAAHRQAMAERISTAAVVDAELRVGATRMTAAMLDLPGASSAWFRAAFGGRIGQRQIAAALMPQHAAPPAGWSLAGLQLVLMAAARQARPGTTHAQVLASLVQAFIAETLAEGGFAITRVCPEPLRPGIAISASPAALDQIIPALGQFRRQTRCLCNDRGSSAKPGEPITDVLI